MNQYQFDAIILLIKILALIAGTVVAIAKGLKTIEIRLSEKSVGATKVKELQKQAEEVKQDIKVLQQVSETCKKEISKLQDDYERLIDHIWDLLGKK